jgi:3-oxoacyl-[acyl-carrier-protein] synthase II
VYGAGLSPERGAPERQRERVGITAIGLVTPLGLGVETFWDGLTSGKSGVRRITLFDASKDRVQIAAEVQDFEPRRFLDFKDAKRLARVAQLAIAASELALAGGALEGLDKQEIGTIVSSGIGGPDAIFDAVAARLAGHAVSPLFIPMAMTNLAAGVIAHRHGLAGPSYAPVSACASSADAIGQGFRSIRDGYASACLVGGAEAAINPVVMSGFASLRALSQHNDEPALAARPFSADRDGFVLGEGACVLLLESLVSAQRRGAHVYAEVCGYGQTSDAHHLTAPLPDGQRAARAVQLALRDAGIAPTLVDYVNAHGTGTLLSDPAETRALHLALGEHAKQVAVSSTKSMHGHLLGAAGAVEAAICALAIERGVLPPTINLTRPDPACDLDYVPNQSRKRRVDVAVTTSMAFGGHNVALVLRRAGSL